MFLKEHPIEEDVSVSKLFELPDMQSLGYLARAVVNNVLRGGELTHDPEAEAESCKVS